MIPDTFSDEVSCFNKINVHEEANMAKSITDNKNSIFDSTKRLICVGFEDKGDIFEKGKRLKAIQILEKTLLNQQRPKRQTIRRASQIELFTKQLNERMNKVKDIPLIRDRINKHRESIKLLQTEGISKCKSDKHFFVTMSSKKKTPKKSQLSSNKNMVSTMNITHSNSTRNNFIQRKHIQGISTFTSYFNNKHINKEPKKLLHINSNHRNLFLTTTTTNSIFHSKSEKNFKIPHIDMKQIKRTMYKTLMTSKSIERDLVPILKSKNQRSHLRFHTTQDKNSLIPLFSDENDEKSQIKKKNKIFLKNRNNGMYTLIDKGHANLITFCDNYLLFNDVDFFKRGKTILSKYPTVQKEADIKVESNDTDNGMRFTKMKSNEFKMKKLAQQIVNMRANINYNVDNFYSKQN